ncbi:sterol desaturase family protein [Breoghania sp. L-A4]|uniref:sterol desaturase family protein n=1 Tax=Breoghania sp. L-A4 TaxID=2304600 RepID=UPI0019678E5B|nr:sterol desaturase family protein [Breoghania sp. L-A4]
MPADWLTLVGDYCLVFVAVYGAMLAVYFLTGVSLSALNARHPERKIQKGRDGGKRMWVEIRSSVSALGVSSLLLSAGYFAQSRGWTIAPLETSWWSVSLMFALSVVLHDGWFYWGHRLLHLPAMYRFHAPHHKSVAPTVWSNDSSTTVDTLIEHGYYLVVWFVLPIPAVALFAHRLFDQVSGMIGHSGFEYFASKSARWPSPFICTSFHDLHHSGFRYNYGNFFSLWDRLMGTVDPRYDAMVADWEQGRDGETDIAGSADKAAGEGRA